MVVSGRPCDETPDGPRPRRKSSRSPHCERRVVRPPERHTSCHCLHRLHVYLSIPLVIARGDERRRSFDQFHDRYVARRTHLKRTDLWRATQSGHWLVTRPIPSCKLVLVQSLGGGPSSRKY